APVTAVAFGHSGQLGVATEDGTLRIYEPPSSKVWKAMRNLGSGSELSSPVFEGSAETRLVWVACGQHVLRFNLDVSEVILTRKDATLEMRLTDQSEDIIINGSHLGYTLDSGTVGVVDLKTQQTSTMRASHANLCTNVSFIPDRPRERRCVGCYDSALLHFDFYLGSLLSSLQIGLYAASSQISLSPPFILSISVAQTGLMACGHANGCIWHGSGREKALSREANSHARQKKRCKWEGLCADDGCYFKTAEGPVVALGFSSSRRLFSLTWLGELALHEVEVGHIQRTICTTESPGLVKANALAVHGSQVVVGGIGPENAGTFILKSFASCEEPESAHFIDAD
ncbi:hypothetical protein JB92DRAFT_2760665, partial [Gautieria morchelliformis]